MSCDTCQDCGCDNVTLPVITGPTGATGATGAPGAAGAGGSAILHNDLVQSTTSSATIALFSASKSYTLPLGTLATNGSKLRITALFTTTGSTYEADSTAYIYFAGASYTAKTAPTTLKFWKSGGEQLLKLELEISRISLTSLMIVANSTVSSLSTGQELISYSFREATFAVADVDANNLIIDARGKTINTTTFNCDQLTVEHLIK